MLPLFALLNGCDDTDTIIFDDELPQFEIKANAILLEVIMPKGSAADDEYYIVGDFNGGAEAAVGNLEWQLEKATGSESKWGIYLLPSTFKDGKTLADGFYFVSASKGEERSVKNEAVVHQLDVKVGTRTNVWVDRWEAYFNTEEEGHDGFVVYVADKSGWDNLYLYGWAGAGDVTPAWPGIAVKGTEVINGVTYKYFDMGKEGEATAEIEQVINLAGQRNKRVRLERVNKEIAEYQFEEVLRTLRSELNRTFVEICFSTRSIGIYDKEIESLGLLMQATKEQQSKGNISLLESSRLESLLLSLRKEKNELENNLVGLHGELNLLLSLPTGQEVTLLLDDEILKQVDAATVSFTDMSRMLSIRPDLKMAHASVAAAQANLKLQRSLAAPEFSIKGMYDRAGNFIDNYFAIGASISVPIFNRNQGNIKSAKLDIQQNGKEEEYAIEKARMELHAAYIRLQKAAELYRSSNDELEHNFGRLIEGVNENFRKRNISMLEFIDYYQSYKETCLQLNELKKEVFLAMENLNTIVGQTVFNY